MNQPRDTLNLDVCTRYPSRDRAPGWIIMAVMPKKREPNRSLDNREINPIEHSHRRRIHGL